MYSSDRRRTKERERENKIIAHLTNSDVKSLWNRATISKHLDIFDLLKVWKGTAGA